MTDDQLRYALEIAKTKSINKAAENLFVSQPNLSRSIKNLEEEIGFKIFTRNHNGIEITLKGNDFLSHASSIIKEYKMIHELANPPIENQSFSISVPKAHYISKAFISFIKKLDNGKPISVDFKECGTIGAIDNVTLHNFNLGIIRYGLEYESFFESVLKEKGLTSIPICEFSYLVAFSKDSELAKIDNLSVEDFKGYIELTQGEPYLPYLNSQNTIEENNQYSKIIRIYDSMGQLSMLNKIPNSFMSIFPLSENTLNKYGLVQKEVKGFSKACKDAIIFRNDYHASNLDKAFFEEIEENVKNMVYHN